MIIDQMTLCTGCATGKHSRHEAWVTPSVECDCDRCLDPAGYAHEQQRRISLFNSPEARERRHALLIAASQFHCLTYADSEEPMYSVEQSVKFAESILSEIERRERER